MTRAAIQWNINQICKAFANGTMRFDNAIQRGYVWDIKRASLLIDSVIRDYPIPAIYTIKTDETIKVKSKEVSVYDCIDGKQRSTTFYRFLNNEFSLSGLDPYIYDDGTEIDLNGKTFEELDEDMQDAIKAYGLTVYYFSEITDEEISEMMSRLNNGKVLTSTENARIKAKNLTAIQQLAKHSLLMDNLSAISIKGYANEDIIIKLALLMNDVTELSSKNLRMAYETYEFGDSDIQKISEVLDFVQAALLSATDDKRIIKRITKKANLITVLYVARQYLDEADGDYEFKVSDFADKLAMFFDGSNGSTVSEDYNNASINGTMKSVNVVTRNDEFYNYVFDNEIP